MNHEIYGHATNVPWAFRFITNIHSWQNGADPVFSPPSHPTQIYEMLYCLIVFGILMYMYWKTKAAQKEGLLFGVFLVGIFLTRFLLEFIKENQVGFEEGMMLNMGQLLSIPFFLLGFYLIFRKTPEHPTGKVKQS
jgi:prolipoprotein diacylglyceryltransferase